MTEQSSDCDSDVDVCNCEYYYRSAECTKATVRIYLELATEGSMKDMLKEFGNVVMLCCR